MITTQNPAANTEVLLESDSICNERNTKTNTSSCTSHPDEEKFSQLYEMYFQSLWYVAFSYLKDTQLAEDIAQETFMKVSENFSAIQDIHSKMTKYFLITITRNKCIDYIRKKKRTPETLLDSHDTLPKQDNLPLEHVINQETLNELAQSINSLDDPYRVPLELRYLHGLSNVEISCRTGLSVNLVAVRINRAKKMLKNRMNLTLL